MKPQARGVQYSLIIHAVVIAGVLGLSTLGIKKHHPVIIDFDLEKPTPLPVQKIRETPLKKSSQPASKKVSQATPASVPREEVRRLPPPAPPKIPETAPTWIQSTSDLTVPVEQPGLPNVPGGFGKTDGSAGGTGYPGFPGADRPPEMAEPAGVTAWKVLALKRPETATWPSISLIFGTRF